MMYRESDEANDLFFTCSFIEHLARITKNTKKKIIVYLGEKNIQKIYQLASIYHSENIEKITDEWIKEANISIGEYNPIQKCKYRVPSYWEIGKIYQRLIIMVSDSPKHYVATLITVLSSWIIEEIDNYNSSLYYENPDYIYECYMEGKIL